MSWTIYNQNLLYFIKCAEEKNISKAGLLLGVTQSTLSLSIKKLEKDIGIILFKRIPRGIELTNQGMNLYNSLINQGKSFEAILKKNINNNIPLEFKIGVDEAFLIKTLLLKKDLKENIKFLSLDNSLMINHIENQKLDLALIISKSVPIGKFKATMVKKLQLNIYGNKKIINKIKKNKEIDILNSIPVISKSNKSLLRAKCNGIITQSTSELKSLVIEGHGIAEIFRESLTKEETKKLYSINLKHPRENYSLYILISKNIDSSKKEILEKIKIYIRNILNKPA